MVGKFYKSARHKSDHLHSVFSQLCQKAGFRKHALDVSSSIKDPVFRLVNTLILLDLSNCLSRIKALLKEHKDLVQGEGELRYYLAYVQYFEDPKSAAKTIKSIDINEFKKKAKLIPVSRLLHLSGLINEKNGFYDAAFRCFSYQNNAAYNPAAFSSIKKVFNKRFHARLDYLQKIKAIPASENGDGLVFLVGFPRSGTTLMDAILSTHEALNVIEEMPTAKKLFLHFNEFEDLTRLANLSQGDCDTGRTDLPAVINEVWKKRCAKHR